MQRKVCIFIVESDLEASRSRPASFPRVFCEFSARFLLSSSYPSPPKGAVVLKIAPADARTITLNCFDSLQHHLPLRPTTRTIIMSLLSFDPFFGNDFRRLQRQYFVDFDRTTDEPESRAWAPRCDVKEVEGQLQVHAELPGVPKENIRVDYDKGYLIISGERSAEKKEENEKWHRVERSYGSFSRSFKVGDYVKPEDIKASFKDGVLEVTLPSPNGSKPEPKRIEVSSA